jgi:agmatinase
MRAYAYGAIKRCVKIRTQIDATRLYRAISELRKFTARWFMLRQASQAGGLWGVTHMRQIAFILVIFFGLIHVPGLHAQAVPTFVGVRTFLGAPYVTNLNDLHADFAVLGVPFDEGTWGQPGERYGPRDLRESSQEYNHDLTEGFYYIDGDRTVLKGKHWADVGDVEIFPTVPAQTDDKITKAVTTILAKKAFPIILGGDHSITFPVVRAFTAPLTVVHFDAHLDTWNGAPGNLDHASWVNRTAQLPHVKNIVQIGMRGLANDPEAVGNARKLHTQIITSEQIHRRGVEWALAQIPQMGDIYISFDVDSMDPTLAPGTGTLEPGGFSFSEIDELLMGVAARGRLVGFDVVEVNPYRDPSGRTAQTAVRLLIDTLGAAFH